MSLQSGHPLVQLIDLLLRLRIGRHRVEMLQLLLNVLDLRLRIGMHPLAGTRTIRSVAHRTGITSMKTGRLMLLVLRLLLSCHVRYRVGTRDLESHRRTSVAHGWVMR